jgi:DNA-binding MarR family transcriptional regulator
MPELASARAVSGDDVVDAVLAASRVLLAVAARSVAGAGSDVTLPQYRALVVLASRGPQSLVELAAVLDVNPSTGTRMCDRLVRKSLIRRYRVAADRRTVRVSLTAAGAQLVRDVTSRRRAEIRQILKRLPKAQRSTVVNALHAFAEAAGEVPDRHWPDGWSGSAR